MSDTRDTFLQLFAGALSMAPNPDAVPDIAALVDVAMVEVERRFPRLAEPLEPVPVPAWTHLEILGHRSHDALVSRELWRGVEGVRVLLVCPLGHIVLNRWYKASAIFSEEASPAAEARGLSWAAATCAHPDCDAVRLAERARQEAYGARLRAIVGALVGALRAIDFHIYSGDLGAWLRGCDALPTEAEEAILVALITARAPATDPRWALMALWPKLVEELQRAINPPTEKPSEEPELAAALED